MNQRFAYDAALAGEGLVAGADEAGRGCLAGPLVAAAVCFDLAALAGQDHVALGSKDASLDDLIDCDFLGSPLQFFRRRRFQGFREFLLPFLLR